MFTHLVDISISFQLIDFDSSLRLSDANDKLFTKSGSVGYQAPELLYASEYYKLSKICEELKKSLSYAEKVHLIYAKVKQENVDLTLIPTGEKKEREIYDGDMIYRRKLHDNSYKKDVSPIPG